jgi:D-sedoheptulose 7-phosphate isomerase
MRTPHRIADEQDRAALDFDGKRTIVNTIERLQSAHDGPAGYAGAYLRYLLEIIRTLDTEPVAKFAELLLDARARGATVFFIGNGGSAATASHFANDIAIGTRTGDDRPFRAVSLCDNPAVLTAIANDEGYDRVFVDQLRVQMRDGDVLVAISASGNSPNVVAAVDYAKSRGATVVGLTGFDGGMVRKMADISVHVDTGKGEYGPVEDVHMIVDHLIGSYLIGHLRKQAAGPAK